MRRFAAFISVLLFCAAMCAQNTRRLSREAIDSLRNPVLVGESRRTLSFASVQHNIGVIYESDAPVEANFVFVNIGSNPETITKVTTNCGCTASSFTGKEIMPGDSGVVVIRYNPHRRSGTVDTNAFIYTASAGDRPVAKLTILGTVVDKDEWTHLPCIMGSLRLKRKSVAFEPVRPGTVPQQRIPCANVGTRPVRLSSQLLPPYLILSTEPVEIAPGEEADIIISVVGDKMPDVLPESINIVVDGVEGRISDCIIKVEIEK